MTLLIIQDVADPQMISVRSFRADAQAFQKCSNAGTKFDCRVSSHGNSSIKITLCASVDRSTSCSKDRNASRQLLIAGHDV